VEIYHLEKGWDAALDPIIIEEQGPLRVVLKCQHAISESSKMVQRIIFEAEQPGIMFDTWVDWNENRKMLASFILVNLF
jgi:alpha-mannosidase